MNTEQLAEELHKFYRAAFKALVAGVQQSHDHGWDHCNKKDYFRRRAELMRKSGLTVLPGDGTIGAIISSPQNGTVMKC